MNSPASSAAAESMQSLQTAGPKESTMSSATTAAEHTPTPTPAPSPFFTKLPKEIRDQIYELAYVEDKTMRILPLEEWMEEERGRRLQAWRESQIHMAGLQPVCPFLPMRVSRQFYAEAVPQFLRVTTLYWPAQHGLFAPSPALDQSRDLQQHLTRFKATWNKFELCRNGDTSGYSVSQFKWLGKCRSIRHIYLTVTEEAFTMFKSRMPCVDQFTSKDYDEILEVHIMAAHPTLQKVKLKPKSSKLAHLETERQVWHRNVRALAAHIAWRVKVYRAAHPQPTEKEPPERNATNVDDDHASDLEDTPEQLHSEPVSLWMAFSNETENTAKKRKASTEEEPRRSAPAARGLIDFARDNPAATAVMSTGLALSVINSILLAKKLL